MTLPAETSLQPDFPIRQGSLFVSAGSVERSAPTNAVEVVVDRRSELSVALLEARGAPERGPALVRDARTLVQSALQRHAPMYEIVSALRRLSASERPVKFGVAILRFAQPESRVEILNAGMPAVACVLPDGELSLHASLSPSIGERFGEVHPYELAPLSWGSSWLVMSEGICRARRNPAELRAWLHDSQLAERASELSRLPAHELTKIVASIDRRGREDADMCLLVVNADPSRHVRTSV